MIFFIEANYVAQGANGNKSAPAVNDVQGQ